MNNDAYFRLRVPEREELTDEARGLQDAAVEKLGFLPNVVSAWAIRPDHLVRWRAHYDLIMQGEGALSRVQREMIAVAVSSVNRCSYCSTTHPAFLRVALIKEGRDPRIAHELLTNPYQAAQEDGPLTPLERAVVVFALKVTVASHEISPGDLGALREAGLSDEGIFDVAEVAAMFNFTNRLASATGLRPNVEYEGMGR